MDKRFLTSDQEEVPLLADYPRQHAESHSLTLFINDTIDELDLSKIEDLYSSSGRRAYPPAALLKAWILGYATGVSSSRRLVEACKYDLRFHYLTGGFKPHLSTFNRFRHNTDQAIMRLCNQLRGTAGTEATQDTDVSDTSTETTEDVEQPQTGSALQELASLIQRLHKQNEP